MTERGYLSVSTDEEDVGAHFYGRSILNMCADGGDTEYESSGEHYEELVRPEQSLQHGHMAADFED